MEPVRIGDQLLYTQHDLLKELHVTRQAFYAWRKSGKVPSGQTAPGRGRQVYFTESEVAFIRDFKNRLEPVELGGSRQLGLFTRIRKEGGA